MIEITSVKNEDELQQIHALNKLNLKQNVSAEEKDKEGFVTWLYSMDLLNKMHALAPSIIAKDNDKVVGYALVTPKEALAFHEDLRAAVENMDTILYDGKLLKDYRYYVMGQVCIDKAYRGKGLFSQLYAKHKELYENKFDMLVTEVSIHNQRSQKAHEKVGFKTINTYTDAVDEWNVIAWDWRED